MTRHEWNLVLRDIIKNNFNKNELLALEPEIKVVSSKFRFDDFPDPYNLMVNELLEYANRHEINSQLAQIIEENIPENKPSFGEQFINICKNRRYTYWEGVQ